MSISLRSNLIAGMAALGASVVAVAPITQPGVLPSAAKVSTAVQLSALANPLTAIGGVIADVNTNLFNQSFYPDDIWPASFADNYLYAPLNYGVIPDVANQFSTGPLVGLVNNLSGDVWAGVRSGIVLGGGVASSLFNVPGATVTAVQQLIAGDPAAAWNTLVTQVFGPLKLGFDGATAGISYIVDNSLQNINTVFTSFLPYLATGLVDSIVKGGGYVLQSIGTTFTAIWNNITQGNLEGAWNAAVDGFLGRNGTLGQVEKLSLGIGIQDGWGKVVIPSPRAVTTSELQRLGGAKAWGDGGITNEPFNPPVPGPTASVGAAAAAPAAPTVSALASAPAPAASADAPKAEVSTVEASVAEAPVVEIPKELSVPDAPAVEGVGTRSVAATGSAPSAAPSASDAADNAPQQSRRAPHRGATAG